MKRAFGLGLLALLHAANAAGQGAHHHHDHHDHSRRHGDQAPREPIPALTDADRAAAFPVLSQHHPQHGTGTHSFWLLEQLEVAEDDEIGWDGGGWIGGDIKRLWLRSDGHAGEGTLERASLELLYGRAVHPWWELVAGVRHDFGEGPSRTALALGLQGLAPYGFEIEATAYLGEGGHALAQVEVGYELLLTNRLILALDGEATLHSRDDRELAAGSGLAGTELGLRLRYEITRQFAPYIGYERQWHHGDTADLRRAAGQAVDDDRWVLGMRLWF